MSLPRYSTPQSPKGCSCTKCFTWVRLFPDMHRRWLEFAAEQRRISGPRWYYRVDWEPGWALFRVECGQASSNPLAGRGD